MADLQYVQYVLRPGCEPELTIYNMFLLLFWGCIYDCTLTLQTVDIVLTMDVFCFKWIMMLKSGMSGSVRLWTYPMHDTHAGNLAWFHWSDNSGSILFAKLIANVFLPTSHILFCLSFNLYYLPDLLLRKDKN